MRPSGKALEGPKWVSSSKKNRRKASAAPWVDRLRDLRALREPYDECLRAMVARLAAGYLDGSGPVVEIGAGSGQLRRWLAEDTASRFIHTDPDGPALAQLAAEYPDSRVAGARVEQLPFESGSCSAVVSLCVLDLVKDLDAAFHEMARVLEPGGHVVHVLDMTPALDVVFSEIAASGNVALPNLFSDPSAARWPQNLLVADGAPLRRLLDLLDPNEHPLRYVFGHYFELFGAAQFDAPRAVAAYDGIARLPETRSLMKSALLSAYEIGWRIGLAPARGTLLSSAEHLSQRLERAARAAGLVVELNDVWTASTHAPRAGNPAYRSLLVGQERKLEELPEVCLCPDATPPAAGAMLVEAGMAVFVARRVEASS